MSGAGKRWRGAADLSGPLAEGLLAMKASDWSRAAGPVLVAVSGGLDSMSLLHAVRFWPVVPPQRIHVAHLDHRMRPTSGGDARWLRGVCTAWNVTCHIEAVADAPFTEAEAREARYGFLARLKDELSAAVVLTGHTADDQAETVLFRAARGAGPDGLTGIWPRVGRGVERPWLGLWRKDLATYARATNLPVREDPTNLDLDWTRNRIRHQVLPALENAVPGAKSSLARLAELSRRQRVAMAEMSDGLLDAWQGSPVRGGSSELILALGPMGSWGDEVVSQVLRRGGERLGVILGQAAVGRLLRLVREGRSGSAVDLQGGLTATCSAGVLRIAPREQPGEAAGAGRSRAAVTLSEEGGQGLWEFHGETRSVVWGACRTEVGGATAQWVRSGGGRMGPDEGLKAAAQVVVLSTRGLRFPLTLRGRMPGDRMPLDGGKKKLKKIMLERGIPSFRRDRVPVLADAGGLVLWIPGLTAPAHDPGRRSTADPVGDTGESATFCVALGHPKELDDHDIE